ncbi:hypothetical protein L7F22_067245 [Adiantum nelumboides]|nr:hypothetical protein [Adiantum nelumboides]
MHSAMYEPPPMVSSSRLTTPPRPLTQPPPTSSATSVHTSTPSEGRPLPRTSNASNPSSSSTSRCKKSSDIWSASDVNVMLDLYEDKCISLNRGNFKVKHWAEIARDIHAQTGINFMESQCKNKWENMKKTFMKEKKKEPNSCAEPFRWEYFNRMEDLLGGTPKVSGLADGFNGINLDGVSLVEDEDMGGEENDGGVVMGGEEENAGNVTGNAFVSDSTNASIGDVGDEDVLPGPSIGQTARGQKVRKRKTAAALTGLGESIERGCSAFTKTLERVEL